MQKHEAIISQVYSVLHEKFAHSWDVIHEKLEKFHQTGARVQKVQRIDDDLDPSIDDLPITLVKDPGPGINRYADLQ